MKIRTVHMTVILLLILSFILGGCGGSSDTPTAALPSVSSASVSKDVSEDPVDTEETERHWYSFFQKDSEVEEDETEEETEEAEESESPYHDMHLSLSLADSGYDVFHPRSGAGFDYRYGPSILREEDGGIYAYFASPGDTNREMDWLTCRYSEDEGHTWSDEKVVLSPTPQSRDKLSVCDPDVFYHDGYYYLGFTGTMDATEGGIVNSVFLARSEDPFGPFEKWNGDGWGGEPEPLIYYDGVWNGWGAGEPSFVIKDDELFVYSTLDSYDAFNNRIKSTVVHRACITDLDWPSKLEFAGYALIRSDAEDEEGYQYFECDSLDMAYVEEYDKFIAVCTNRRLRSDSCLLYFESNDGICFKRVSELNTNVCNGCHNAGIMSDKEGHIKPSDPVILGYAYGGSGGAGWGVWVTRFVKADLEISEEMHREEDGAPNLKASVSRGGRQINPGVLFVNSYSLVNRIVDGREGFMPSAVYYDENWSRHTVDPSDLMVEIYDEGVACYDTGSGMIKPVSPGITTARIIYEDVGREICIDVLDASENTNGSAVTEFRAPIDEYQVSLSTPYATAIRPLVRYSNDRLYEPDLIGMRNLGIRFIADDEEICAVRGDGMLIPMSEGETGVTVFCGSFSFRVRIVVSA